MVVTKRSIMIPVDELQPHPDNPRKDLGDLTELADSIRANGIFQNLTVLRNKDPETGKSTVIIGHRRLAAAKLAGLEKVPCMVVEMDEKEQISTMLLENMQRSDLTIYEQAQGFQMMLDMGETKYDIAEKTGFSITTIRHRLNLLKLDPEELRKAEERQVTMQDMIELERISDPKLKNAALKEAGTNNFRYAVEKAVAEESRRAIAHAWKKLFGSLGEEIPYSEKTKKRQIRSYYMSRSPEEQKESISKLAADNAPVYWCVDQYNYIYLLGEPKADAPDADEAKEKYRLEQQVKAAKLERIREVENRAKKLRLDFVKGYSRHNGMTALLIELIREEPEICDVNWSFAAELCGVKLVPEKDEDGDEDVTADVFAENSDIIYALVNNPAKVLLAMLAAYLEESLYHTLSVHSGIGEHRQNEHLDRWYATLQKLGYSISDDEKAMLDGTHECFGKNEEEN